MSIFVGKGSNVFIHISHCHSALYDLCGWVICFKIETALTDIGFC